MATAASQSRSKRCPRGPLSTRTHPSSSSPPTTGVYYRHLGDAEITAVCAMPEGSVVYPHTPVLVITAYDRCVDVFVNMRVGMWVSMCVIVCVPALLSANANTCQH